LTCAFNETVDIDGHNITVDEDYLPLFKMTEFGFGKTNFDNNTETYQNMIPPAILDFPLIDKIGFSLEVNGLILPEDYSYTKFV